jgi:lipopolysaccharide/colanic/teichoic acid biosynthesis glycosyltransferase
MQTETLQNVPKVDKKQYLRVAAISSKSALCFFYVGRNERSIDFLNQSFENGFSASNLDEARQLLKPHSTGKEVDVIILDTTYDEKELNEFHSFLKNRELDCIPVLYNYQQLKSVPAARQHFIIDDVIDLSNWQFDFSNKVSFIKKIKAQNFSLNQKNRIEPTRSAIKRIFDILLATILLVILSPFFLLIALAVKLESRGPVFYNSKRAGRGFKIFNFYKFRTMEVNADKKVEALLHLNQYSDNKAANFFKISNDPRITKVGRFLRNTSLDELPQLFNVIKGDMSLVGNRPLPLYEASTLTTNEFVERFMAPAGMTGLWQIKKRGQAEMSCEERINLDISYARNSSMLYDLWIMANTPKALLQKSDV